MGICTNCWHFRRARPLSQMLAAEFTTNDSDVSKELKSLQEDERKLRDSEADSMRLQASMGKLHFLSRPRMTDFCALEEESGTYLIPELKNVGGSCKLFKAEARVRKACADCLHLVKAQGRERDARQEKLFASLKISAIGAQSSPSEAESMMSSHRSNVTARKAFEISSVMLNRGELPSRPDYLDYCGLFSKDDNYVVCVLRNPYHTCGKWEKNVSPPTPAKAGANPNLGAALQSTSVPFMAPPMMGTPLMQFSPAAAKGGADPALLGQLTDAFEWLLGVVIPPPVRSMLEAGVAASFAKGDQAEITGVTQLVQLFQTVQMQPPEVHAAIREAHQPEVVAGLRAANDQTAQALVALYDAANAPIAWGNPPLTREIANCYLDLIGFVQSLAMNMEWQPLPEHARTQQIQMLAAQYPGLPPQQQAWFGNLPRGWTAMRAGWVTAPPHTRGQLRDQILASMGIQAPPSYTAPEPPPFAGPYGPVPYHQVMQEQYAPPPYGQPQYDQPAYQQPGGEGSTTDQLLQQILADDKKKEAEAAKESPEFALQVRLQNSARTAQMLSNIFQIRHDSLKTIVGNIKS